MAVLMHPLLGALDVQQFFRSYHKYLSPCPEPGTVVNAMSTGGAVQMITLPVLMGLTFL